MKPTHAITAALKKAEAEGRVTEHGKAALLPWWPSPTEAGLKEPWSITVAVPCRVRSEANERCHWSIRQLRFKHQGLALFLALMKGPKLLCFDQNKKLIVTWTHIGKKMDSDNLAGAFKGMRDTLARMINVDDGDERIIWVYEQRPGKGGVEVKIESATDLPPPPEGA